MSPFPEQYFIALRPPADPWARSVDPKAWQEAILRILATIGATHAGGRSCGQFGVRNNGSRWSLPFGASVMPMVPFAC